MRPATITTSHMRRPKMSSTSPADTPADLISRRRTALRETVGRPLQTPTADGSPFPGERRQYLLEEAQELYWNDLEWENVTGEEELEGGRLIELTFPGVLAFVRGLLLTEVPADALSGPAPRPQVVEDLLAFLAERIIEFRRDRENGSSEDPDGAARDLRMTSELLDQVLLVYHGVSPEDVGPEQPDPGGSLD